MEVIRGQYNEMSHDKNDYLKMYYDAEFTELSSCAKLISIGIKSESGTYFYAEFNYDENQITYTDWIRQHVIGNLIFNNHKEFYNLISDESEMSYSVDIKLHPDAISSALRTWLKNEFDLGGHRKIEFYTDCYAYDWMCLNNLISEGGNALNIPNYISYIPIDLSTALKLTGEDPDITREDYISHEKLNEISNYSPFVRWASNKIYSGIQPGVLPKHNALWDAMVCEACFEKIIHNNNTHPSVMCSTPIQSFGVRNRNQREYDANIMDNIESMKNSGYDLHGEM